MAVGNPSTNTHVACATRSGGKVPESTNRCPMGVFSTRVLPVNQFSSDPHTTRSNSALLFLFLRPMNRSSPPSGAAISLVIAPRDRIPKQRKTAHASYFSPRLPAQGGRAPKGQSSMAARSDHCTPPDGRGAHAALETHERHTSWGPPCPGRNKFRVVLSHAQRGAKEGQSTLPHCM